MRASLPYSEAVPDTLVLIIVCDNTNIAEVLYRNISGEKVVPVLEDVGEEEEREDQEGTAFGRKKPKMKIVYGDSSFFPQYFSNREGVRRTIGIDTKLLAEAEAALGS